MWPVLVKTESDGTASAWNPYVVAGVIFLFSVALFLSLRTHQYLAVDGAIRCVEVYRRPELFFHQNNHLLYPANIYFWTSALDLLGLRARTPFEFIGHSQALNAVAAGGCLSVVYVLTWFATSSTGISLAITSAYGFSRAFLLHATNSAEPLVGLFYSALGILVVTESLRRDRNWPLFIGGAVFGLAQASYQSMILIAPLAALFCFGWPIVDQKRGPLNARLIRSALLASGWFLAVCAIYGWAYCKSGPMTLPGMIHRFFELPGGSVYGSFGVGKLANLPFGLVSALLPALPPDYSGIRSLLREPHAGFWITCFLMALMWLCRLFWLLARPVMTKWRNINRSQALLLSALLSSLLIFAFPLIYWDPLYDKLWLQPLGLIALSFGVLYRFGSPHRRFGATAITSVAFIILEAGLNLLWAIPSHHNPQNGLAESAVVADIVKSEDFIVLNFDEVSSLYLALWGSAGNTLLLPASEPRVAADSITRAMKRTHEHGGSVYFLSVLDMTEKSWSDFLGRQIGIPYHSFDSYRSSSTVVRSFEVNGHVVILRKL